MSGFKLLAIVPLKDCDTKFRKNLSIGTPYKFLNNVTIELNKANSKISKVVIDKHNTIEDLYNLQNGINIEISAVVGLNGSGKSTLIELLYYFIYAISIHNDKEKLLEEHSEIIQSKINYQRNDTNKLYSDSKKTNALDLLKISKNHDLTFYKKDFEGITSSQTLIKNALIKRSGYLHEIKKNDEENEKLIKEKLAVGLVYETSQGIHSISFLNGDVKYYKYNSNGMPAIDNNFFFDPFFYSICLNYSHHSLNSKVIGNWINSLFHKNDGYVTPVVINPMRDEGNFNINRELHLSNERVMSNLTYDVVNNSEVSLLKKYELKKFLFIVKKDFTLIKSKGFEDINAELKATITKNYEKNEFDNLKSVKLVRSILGNDSLMNYTNYLDYALGYLENKIDKIKNNYSQLFNDVNGNFSNSKFMYFLRNNESHITKKLRQTINFIDKTNNNNKSIWNKTKNYDYEEFDIDQFKSWLSECNPNYQKLSPSALMNFALPGFFNIDFEIITKDKTIIKLSDLSSGEQQMIFNINTITYHLYNLQSIHTDKEDKNNEEGEGINRLKYKNVSIILDEVEIYYHPEMQRELTFNLLNTLENIKEKGQKGIESIHIIYLTHSPFILSDIAPSNTLLLEEGKIAIKDDFKTFGANIYDLLADSFFLKGFTGKFAELKINSTIKWLFDLYDKFNNNKLTFDLYPSSDLIKTHKQIIDLIDEPILKRKLLEIYSIVFSQENEKERQIKEVTKMAESLGLKVTKISDK